MVLWQCLTELEKSKQGAALALSLEGKARAIAINLGIGTLIGDVTFCCTCCSSSTGGKTNTAAIQFHVNQPSEDLVIIIINGV